MPLAAILLGFCQFLFMAAVAVSIAFGGLVGEQLAGTPALATLPYLVITASTAVFTLLLPQLFGRLGYRTGFTWGCLAGAAGGGLAAWSIYQASFLGFCLAGFFLGTFQATSLYYRFAAADAVTDGNKGRAVAWVMSGGIPAALVGPMLAAYMLDVLPVQYTGSYLLAALLALLALPLLALARLPTREPLSTSSPPAPIAAVVRYPNAMAAVIFCAGGYGVMMLVMLTSPLAMSAHGHGAGDAASVIQWHLLGMFAPSLLTGKLIDRYQARPVALVGCAILGAGCVIALLGTNLTAFHAALLLVGIGWNLMYMGGTTLITRIADNQLRGRLQALNESTTFMVMTFTAGLAGWLYHGLGWQLLLIVAGALVLAISLAGLLSRR